MQNQSGGNGDSRAGRFSPAEISLVTTAGEIIVSLRSALDAMRNCNPFATGALLYATAPNDRGAPLSRALHRFFLSSRKGGQRGRDRRKGCKGIGTRA